MEKILYINACVRKNSRTRQLAEYLLSLFTGDIKEIDLQKENLTPLSEFSGFLFKNGILQKTAYEQANLTGAKILEVKTTF